MDTPGTTRRNPDLDLPQDPRHSPGLTVPVPLTGAETSFALGRFPHRFRLPVGPTPFSIFDDAPSGVPTLLRPTLPTRTPSRIFGDSHRPTDTPRGRPRPVPLPTTHRGCSVLLTTPSTPPLDPGGPGVRPTSPGRVSASVGSGRYAGTSRHCVWSGPLRGGPETHPPLVSHSVRR